MPLRGRQIGGSATAVAVEWSIVIAGDLSLAERATLKHALEGDG